MKVQIACLSLASLAIVATATSTVAADFGNNGAGSIKDMGAAAAVPVPAPVPIPEYRPSWYFRLDAGIGTVSSPSVSESGYTYGDIINGANGYDGTFADGPELQSLDPAWFNGDFSNLSTFGAGVGYYLGNGWRMDATVEKRSNDQIHISGSDSWDSHGYYDATHSGGAHDTYGTDVNGDLDGDGDGGDLDVDGVLDNPEVDRRTQITVSDKIDVDGTVWMANAYYDMASRRGFTPYIGAGIGFVWNELDRTHTTTVESCALEAPCGGNVTEYTNSTTDKTSTISLAAAAMAGFSYQMTDITSVDVGYRYLYLGGTDFVTTIDGQQSRITIGDQHAHQVRAGLRFDVN